MPVIHIQDRETFDVTAYDAGANEIGFLPCSEVLAKYFTDGQAENIRDKLEMEFTEESYNELICFDLESAVMKPSLGPYM